MTEGLVLSFTVIHVCSAMIRILVDTPVDEPALAKLRAMPEVQLELVEPQERVRSLPAELLRPIEVLTCTYPPENFSV